MMPISISPLTSPPVADNPSKRKMWMVHPVNRLIVSRTGSSAIDHEIRFDSLYLSFMIELFKAAWSSCGKIPMEG
jgi:hypothetical protein